MIMKQDDFKYRYIIKMLSSVLLVAINMVVQVLLPRAFSVEEYGFYTYNLNVFTSVVTIANLSFSNALVAKYAKRNDEIGLVNFYLKFYIAMALAINALLMLLYAVGVLRDTFAGQTLLTILLGLEAAVVNKLLTDCISTYDACAISRVPAVGQLILKVLVSALIIAGYLLGKLNLIYLYIVQISITLILVCVLLRMLIANQNRTYEKKDLGTSHYWKEYISFCAPLIPATFVAQFTTIVMNWALMNWAGAREQAYFGVAWQLNVLISYVFSPYAELSKREFAVLHDQPVPLKDRVVQAFQLMTWATTYFAIFISFMSRWILPVLFGDTYAGIGRVVSVVMLYTIYQAWGQICGSFMLATEKTKVNAVISIIGQLFTIIFIFLFQKPNTIWENGLGAVGIGLNYFLANLIATMAMVVYICKSLCIPTGAILRMQLHPILLCTVLSFALQQICNVLPIPDMGIVDELLTLLLAGVVYTGILGLYLYCNPKAIGISKSTLQGMLRRKKNG